MSERVRQDQEQKKRPQTHDERYAYRDSHSDGSICRVRIWELAGKPPIITVTELADNTHISITNLRENLAYEIIRSHSPSASRKMTQRSGLSTMNALRISGIDRVGVRPGGFHGPYPASAGLDSKGVERWTSFDVRAGKVLDPIT